MVSNKNKGGSNNTSNTGKVSATIRNRMRRPPPIQTSTGGDNDGTTTTTMSNSHGVPMRLTKGLKKKDKTSASSTGVSASTPTNFRGSTDIRSPGIDQTPTHQEETTTTTIVDAVPIPDFITQTDKYGNASTPRTAPVTPSTPSSTTDLPSTGTDSTDHEDRDPDEEEEEDDDEDIPGVGYSHHENDACETLLESLRMMCCCLLPESSTAHPQDDAHVQVYATTPSTTTTPDRNAKRRSLTVPKSQITIREKEDPTLDIRLLPTIPSQDRNFGRKCLVLDLDETLVHSSFRAVQGADFVLPVQIEEVVHYVYVMKRPGVDEFLVEMAKHYEVVVYTASLNKYADPLLDLLDPHKTIAHRLFRESCVFHEGNYVKDLSLLNRHLSQTIIVDNSPSSYSFHPENAIDCTSFIDDPQDVELKQIGSFLTGVRDVKDVRNVCHLWREWPNVPSHLMKRQSTTSTVNEEDDIQGYWSNGNTQQQYLEARQDVGNRQ